jgi:hypothetical protein
MRIAVIAQVEAQHIKAAIKKLLREGKYVERFSVAFPAVDQNHGPIQPRQSRARRIGMKALQAHAVSTIEQNFLARCAQRRGARHNPAAPHPHTRQNGLQVAIAQPSRRAKIFNDA